MNKQETVRENAKHKIVLAGAPHFELGFGYRVLGNILCEKPNKLHDLNLVGEPIVWRKRMRLAEVRSFCTAWASDIQNVKTNYANRHALNKLHFRIGGGEAFDEQRVRAVGAHLFKVHKSQLGVVERALETAALMVGTDKSRGYCLEMICADFLAGASLECGDQESLIGSLCRAATLLPHELKQELVEKLKLWPRTGQ